MKIISNSFAKINIDKKDQNIDILDYAVQLAQFHNWLGLKNTGISLLPTIRERSSFIKESYSEINEYYYNTEDVIPAAEWYLDNYYLINELSRELMKDISKDYESKLLYLAGGDFAGYPRIYLLVSEYINSTQNELDFQQLKNFVTKYQTESPLTSAEIWAIPIMLKIIMLDKIYYQVERLIHIQGERELAENWLKSVLGHGSEENDLPNQDLDSSKSFSPVYIERIARRLKEHGPDAKVLLNWLDNVASKQNLTVEKVINTEYHYLTSHGVLMGNIVAATKMINSENWSEFFEGVSLVQQVLESDPAGVFPKMDFESRDKYRHEIEALASKYKVSELTAAKTIEELAAAAQDTPQNHVGYYLLGKGREQLEKELTTNWKVRQSFQGILSFHKRRPTLSYLGLITLVTILPFLLFIWYMQGTISETMSGVNFLVAFLALLLINGMAVYACNRLFCNVLPASFLPKLDFNNGIPDENKTVVVVPAIFCRADKVKEQLRQLEVHYLNNPDKNLSFALLGDFCDAQEETMPGDQEIIAAGIKGISKLNAKYGKDKFFYFHRARKWNPKERTWMGWERKRGKLIEFNSFLLNEGETSYFIKNDQADSLKNIRYILTLDADTILPRDSARKLIGTIAHPMQAAKMDTENNRIISGYGIIQPRIGLTAASAFATPFSTIFTGTAGLDPYTCAISDIYQDLFKEGIYTGKGIYDLKVFHSLTKDVFPENAILSHDLIEGLYARTGLATDIELFDGYPTKYLSATKRAHRWIRGDWQIARYIFNKELAAISRWKIIDNLRRSMEVPSQLLMLFMAFTYFQSMFSILFGLILLSLSLPLVLNILGRIYAKSITLRILRFELRLGLSQIAFSLAVLPYQAYIQTDAILRSIGRQIFTKRSLLEWEPAADSENKLKLDPKNFYSLMYPGIALSLIFLAGYYYANLLTGLVLSVLVIAWVSSPLLAYKLSMPYAEEDKELSAEDRKELRKWARPIWAFFDIFVNSENNYLPPDNLQLEPYKGVAQRTSPTNIGLALLANLAAEDLGYISKKTMLQRVSATLRTIRKLPKWNGHIYNWYNTHNLAPLHPIYISTVDSGNFASYLITLKNGLKELTKKPLVEKSILEGIEDTFHLIEKGDLANLPLGEAFRTELKELKQLNKSDSGQERLDLKVCYQFISRWEERFSPLTKNIVETKDRNIEASNPEFWLTSLWHLLKDHKEVIELFYPYLLSQDNPSIRQELSHLNPGLLLKEYLLLLKKSKDIKGSKHSKEEKVSLSKELRSLLKKGVKNTALLLLRLSRLERELKKLAFEMDFKPLFDKQKGLFSIGYNLNEQRLDKSYYDLLASEARLTSLLAIAKGDVPEAHWFKLARPLTRVEGNRCLVSWSGTMFEFLMPIILLKKYRGTLLDESYQSVVKIQQSYAAKGQAPWGISESGFFSFDIQTNYQYKAFGVPGLGLKRGLSKDLVVSPYSTFMALDVDLKGSIDNLKHMMRKGFNGLYGLYEAIDFTKTRVPYNEEFSLVKSYMAHHQGMSFIALNNILTQHKMQKRFHQEPMIRSIELLLQEQIPIQEYTFNPKIEEVNEEKVPATSRQHAEKPVVYLTPDTYMPRTSFISNREYSVMLTLAGSGYSQYNDILVSRWREDPTIEQYGTFIYVQNLNSGEVWSTTSKPMDKRSKEYKVTCFPNSIKFYRKDGNIITQTKVFVTPEDPVEIRRVSLTNLSQYSRDIQLTSYFEVVLDQLKADVAHPTFSKLFIQTRFENQTLVAFRRPRHHDKKKCYLMHTTFTEGEMLGEVEYETDRTKFIGRGRTLANPKALDFNQPLSNSIGAVLDPIMSIRSRIRIYPGKTVSVYYLTGVGEKKDSVLRLADKYRSSYVINQAKELAWSQNLMELTNLDLSFDEANMLSSLASLMIFPGPGRRSMDIQNNQKGQSSLWPLGISGDLPIALLKIQDNNQLQLVDQMLKIHEYWKIKGLFIDLVILNEDKTGYFQSIQEMIQEKISISHVRKLVNKPGGVFLIKDDQLPTESVLLLHIVARIIFSGENGSLHNQILKYVRLAEHYLLAEKRKLYIKQEGGSGLETDSSRRINELKEQLLFYNGYGGFTSDGKEYVIVTDSETTTPLPWVNIIANPKFGTLVTEGGASYSWSQNSREYKLTPWSNDPLLDISGEGVYLRDEKTGVNWSPTPQPAKDKLPYIIRHGQGYSVYEHCSNGLKQETTVYVPMNESIKIIQLKLTNITHFDKQLSAYYYLEWVLGVTRELNAPYLVTHTQENVIFCRNVYQEEFSGRVAFLGTFGGHFKSYTADRKDFIGINRTLKNPSALMKQNLSGKTGNGLDPCGVIQLEIGLRPGEEKTVYFLLGDEENQAAALSLVKSFSNRKQLAEAYQETVNYWDDLLSTLQINTPEKTLDLLFNRWLVYQALACRIWSRSAFYQSGGAIGFRDQLQDVMSLAVLRPEITRRQIVLHSSRQFPEGDVQHWWHPETGKGIRTKFSDDLLWLPYVTADYIEHSGDLSVLDEKTQFLEQELLSENEDERYAIPTVSDSFASVYEHCVRAIDHSLKFGEHGLPLIGTGDWNDGFSAIGREGKGESVWLGWFLLTTLKAFIPLCQNRGDQVRVQQYQEIVVNLTENMEKNAWDGSWYRRAYYDDGSPLGSIANTECQIDSIAQSWAVISQSAKESRARDAMLAMERYLWDKEENLLKLFTPPLDKTKKNPGYIKGYIPGVRENGGQYTHGAIWAVLALTMLGKRDKALELFNMLNPINHSRTNIEVAKYKTEPYVMAADVYAVQPNVGRGGWSWYTGAAGWMYQVALEGILGFQLKSNKLTLAPCVPMNWHAYSLNYRYKSSKYTIQIKLDQEQNEKYIVVDGVTQKGFPIELKDDGRNHVVEVVM